MNRPRQMLTQLIMSLLPTDLYSTTENHSPKPIRPSNRSPLLAEALADAIIGEFQLTPRNDPSEPSESSDPEPEVTYAFDNLQRLILTVHSNPGEATAYHYDPM